MKLENNELAGLLAAVAITRDQEMDCDDCLAQVGRFAEHELAGKTPSEASEKLRQHLAVCFDCREEYQALLAALGPAA